MLLPYLNKVILIGVGLCDEAAGDVPADLHAAAVIILPVDFKVEC